MTTGADADYPFTTDDFKLLDRAYGVKVVTLPGRGALEIDGVPGRVGDSVSHAAIKSGDLTYTPPRGQVGDDISNFNFKVNDGELDSANSYRMVIDVDNKLAGNLDQTPAGTALSLPTTGASAYAQRLRTGSSAQEIEEVRLAITAPSGVTPKVSIWYGESKPEREVDGLVLSNPSNIHTAAVAVKKFTANSKDNGRYSLAVNSANYWIVVERAVNTGVISLKQTTAGNDATAAGGWALTGNHWKKGTSNSWSEGTTGALQAELRTVPSRRYGFRILNMELAGPGGDELYTDGEDLRITATLSEPAHIDGTVINLPPHFCDAAGVKEGNGTDRIVFGCRIRGGPHTRVHVEADSVRPGSGGDGPRLSDAHPAVERMTAVHGVTGPGITDVRVNSPGSDGLWTPGERAGGALYVRRAHDGDDAQRHAGGMGPAGLRVRQNLRGGSAVRPDRYERCEHAGVRQDAGWKGTDNGVGDTGQFAVPETRRYRQYGDRGDRGLHPQRLPHRCWRTLRVAPRRNLVR